MLLVALIDAVAKRRPDHIAVVDPKRRLTYAELVAARERVAAGLQSAGLRPGDRLAVSLPNSAELAIVYYAAFLAGVVIVPINARLAAPEVDYLLTHSSASAIVVHDSLIDRLPADRSGVSEARIWTVGGGHSTFTALEQCSDPFVSVPLDPQTPAAILYTSGTTSKPKGVTHSHSTLWNTASNQAWSQEFSADDVHLLSLSAAHIAAFAGQLLTSAYAGGTSVLLANPSAQEILDAIVTYRVTYLQMTPAILGQLLELVTDPKQMSSVKCCLAGGDVVPTTTHEKFQAITGYDVTEVCGMTESFSYVMNPPFGEHRLGSIGVPTHGTRVRIGREDGSQAAADEVGELQVQAASTMVGYWNDPDRTAEVFVDGWLHTGDMGRMDSDGWFTFAARRTDLIIHVDENISPFEVEDALLKHPDVREAAVVGIPDVEVGERIGAQVVLHPGASVTAEELIAFAATRLAQYEIPERIEIVAALPQNATGKVDRRAVLAHMLKV